MGRVGKIVLAILVVTIILVATMSAHQKGWLPGDETPPGADDSLPPGPVNYDVAVNCTTASITLRDNMSGAPLSSVRLVLYGPGLGQDRWVMPGGNASARMLQGVEVIYADVDGNGEVSIGDGMQVRSDDGLAFGVWHLCVVQSVEGGERNESLRFQVLPPGTGPFKDALVVHFLDVGQGDATLIRTSDCRWVLIDAGPSGSADRLLDQLEAREVDRIDALVISHPHTDHYGGADEVLEAYDVGSVYHPGLDSTAKVWATFLQLVEDEGCPVYTDEHLDPGDYLNISWTEDFRVMWLASSGDTNDASLVLMVANQGMSILFTGDLEHKGEALLIEIWSGTDVDVDVLKVAHHGSRGSSSMEFLQLVTPERAVIPVGNGNSYGHPHEETLERLAEMGVEVERTDRGAVTIIQ